MLRKSPYLNTQAVHDRFVLWHSLRGQAQIVSREYLDWLETPTERVPVNLMHNAVAHHHLVEEGMDERQPLARRAEDTGREAAMFHHLENIGVILSKQCNFDCSYCVVKTMHGPQSLREKVIPDLSGIVRAIHIVLSQLPEQPKSVGLGFTGGEPLLQWKSIKRLIQTLRQDFPPIEFNVTVNTNASLITAHLAQELAQYRVNLSISLDGPESFHNLVRTYYRVNKGTYKGVVDAIGNLRDYHVAVSSIYLTLTDATFNISPQTLIAWLADLECTSVTVEPDLVNSSQHPPLDMVERLMEYEWACRDAHITLHGFWKRPFLNLVGARQGGDATSFCGSLQGTNLVLTETGAISVCGYSAISLGDIYHLDNLPALQDRWGAFVVENQRGQITACRDCPIEGVCMGGCYLTREFSETTDAPIFHERCTIYLEATRNLLNDAVEHLAPV